MKPYNPNRFSQDETGQWWWHSTSNGEPYRLRTSVLSCERCHEDYVNPANRKNRKYCSRSCASQVFMDKNPDFFKGENSGNWCGGRIMCKGYVLLHRPQHPVCQNNKRKYIAEHRIVMEEHLGRYLESYESVHHKNGCRDDNRLENLELWTKVHPYGVRVNDLPHCPTCTCGKH